MSKTAIIDYGVGNLFSLSSSLRYLGNEAVVTRDAKEIRRAARIILPGVGAFGDAADKLAATGLIPVLHEQVAAGKPLLGICLGMQLMCSHSEEGNAQGLGIFDVDVRRFQPRQHEDKIPHMGWNTLSDLKGSLFEGLGEEEYVYFVHSYFVPVCEGTAAVTHYIHPFSAALQKDNFYATQFHPEKSGRVGEQILRNFLAL